MTRVAKEIEAMRERREEVEAQNLESDLDYYYPGFRRISNTELPWVGKD